MSLPVPPDNTSAPVEPDNESLPAPPVNESAPVLPDNVSLPPPPKTDAPTADNVVEFVKFPATPEASMLVKAVPPPVTVVALAPVTVRDFKLVLVTPTEREFVSLPAAKLLMVAVSMPVAVTAPAVKAVVVVDLPTVTVNESAVPAVQAVKRYFRVRLD